VVPRALHFPRSARPRIRIHSQNNNNNNDAAPYTKRRRARGRTVLCDLRRRWETLTRPGAAGRNQRRRGGEVRACARMDPNGTAISRVTVGSMDGRETTNARGRRKFRALPATRHRADPVPCRLADGSVRVRARTHALHRDAERKHARAFGGGAVTGRRAYLL